MSKVDLNTRPKLSLQEAATKEFDAIVIGSGFGGSMAASELVEGGWRVLMIERGNWVERSPANWGRDGVFVRTPSYAADTQYDVILETSRTTQNLCTCVGGASVFYGGASFRFRERDFDAAPEIVADTGSEWPIGYDALEPYYNRAEKMLHIAGKAGEDPTEPPRREPYPQSPAPLAGTSRRIANAARSLGLKPFRIPMAINSTPEVGPVCRQCTTCDAFACAIGAKNDLATRVIPNLLRRGMGLLTSTVVTRLSVQNGRIAAVQCLDKETGERVELSASTVVLAAGALATPHLLLTSGLEQYNPAGDLVGRHLMRHCNAVNFGIFARPPNPSDEHHKQVALHDFYFGVEDSSAPTGKLGNLQQMMGPDPGLLAHALPRLGWLAGPANILARRMTGLLAIAEDQPRPENRVRIDTGVHDPYGVPKMLVEHCYTTRDLAARSFLAAKAKRILRKAGAIVTFTFNVTSFSHAVGTVRMGDDERTAPLDENCKYRGLDNLYVTDGSVFPTSAGVNPSLTIAANALRVGRIIAGTKPKLLARQVIGLVS